MGELGIAPRIYACWVCSKRGSGFPAMGYYVMQKIDFIYGEKFPSKSLPGKPAPPAVEKQLVNVVAKMVSHGIIHNDLHPGNIGVLKNGKLVIFDYGFSQRADVEIKFPEQVLMAQLYTIIEQYAKPIMFNSLIYDTIYKIRQGKLKL
jgi:RIO-like serine/threonine protein kinase